jgi:hypothetical protein
MEVSDDLVLSGELIYYAHELDTSFDCLDIPPISDPHYGNPMFTKKHFITTLEFLKRPNAYTFLNGDLCESTLRTSKGEIYKQVGSPQDQRDWMIDTLYPYRTHILGAVKGNHEDRIWQEAGVDIVKDIAGALGIPYRPEGLLHKISFGSGNNWMPTRPFVFWIYQTHGYGGARTKSAKAVKVERTSTWIHADAYCMSHDHVVNVAPDIYLLPDPRTVMQKNAKGEETGFKIGKVIEHRKMLIKTNAFLKWGGYSEMGGWPPVDLTTPLIKLLTPKSTFWEGLPSKPRQAIRVVV